ncbi:MAG: glutamate synthase-related protein [Gammaproteobacteria bacterium]
MKRIFIYSLALLTIAIIAAAFVWPWMWWVFIVLGPLLVVAIYDLLQKKHTILRNYPIVGHIRYFLEDFRHHIRQYLIQGDKEGDPFNRMQRSIVYQRAKHDPDLVPFGTIIDVYSEGAEWFEHSLAPLDPPDEPPRIRFGNAQCAKPYEAALLNISAMSFGALSKHAILALNEGASIGGFAHNTGEGGLSRYHLKPGGDVIWEIGTGYFGCRTADGRFDPELFEDKATLDVVKMIELKLSQGAKPGGGGILPGAKVTPDIASARGVPIGKDVVSPARHGTFGTPIEMMHYIAKLRELCGGKPVGFKLCIGRRDQFLALCKAMLETGILPDYVVVDGNEGGTGAAPAEFADHIGVPLREALIFVHNALVGAGLREQIRVVATGKMIDGFDIARALAIGADACYSARGMMFALGCIQARTCHTNRCPTGVATQDPWRVSGLVVKDKAKRVASYHASTVYHFQKLLAACGFESPEQLQPKHLKQRISAFEISDYARLHTYLEPEALLQGHAPGAYRDAWAAADPGSF